MSRQTERIREMEDRRAAAQAALDDLRDALEVYRAMQPEIRTLAEYYGSREWRRDLDDDAKGKFPPELLRGVLSEDGIYDLLQEDRELAAELAETAAAFIRDPAV